MTVHYIQQNVYMYTLEVMGVNGKSDYIFKYQEY